MFNILTEDGSFNITQENSAYILQEFLGVSGSISATPALSSTQATSVSISATVSSTVATTATAIQAITVSATINSIGVLFSAQSKARSTSGVIISTTSLSSTQSYSISLGATVNARALLSSVAGGTVTTSATISAMAELSVIVQSTRPEPITNFRVTRSGSIASLTWTNGLRTAKVEVYRSIGVRATFSKIGETTNQSYNGGINPSETYSYQLVPIGNTGAQGEATYIVYSATDNVL